MDYLIINDIPTPWREPVFERVYQKLDGAVQVVYFKNNEKRRLWTFKMGSHPKTILKASRSPLAGPNVSSILGLCHSSSGDARAWPSCSPASRTPAAGWPWGCAGCSERRWLCWTIRGWGGTRVSAVCSAGHDVWSTTGSATPLWDQAGRHWRCSGTTTAAFADEQCFLSHLVADNDYFESRLAGRRLERRFDVMFSGRIVTVKNPVFFAEVCAGIKARLGRCRVLVIGEGEEALKAQMRRIFERARRLLRIRRFHPARSPAGPLRPGRLLLLPTSGDCWGVVINEAMIAGTPVITTEWTAAAGELVLHGRNGYVFLSTCRSGLRLRASFFPSHARWEFFSQRPPDREGVQLRQSRSRHSRRIRVLECQGLARRALG